jgi:tetratricopeptide (TPR) repeat protein
VPDRHEPTRLRMLGRVLTRQGRYSEAKRRLEESYPATVHRYRAHTLLDMGMAQRGDGQIREAIETFQQGLAITEETGDRPAQSDLLLELGFTLLQIGETDIALGHLRNALTIAEAVGRQRNFALGEMGLGLADMQRGEMESARSHLVQALLAETTLKAPPDVLNILAAVGAFYAAEGEEAAAADVLEIVRLHPATSAETRSRALGLLQTLGAEPNAPQSQLPPDMARQRLEEVAHDTLAELENRPIHPPG